MIQFIVMMFGLIFSNGKETNHSPYAQATIQNSTIPGESLDTGEGNGNGNGHGNGRNTGGNTGQTPP